jgi:endoglucanase
MKRYSLLVSSVLALGLTAQAKTPVETYGRLIAKSGGLYDSAGSKQVVLRGMSMFWSSEPDGYNFFHPQTIAWLRSDWMASVVRVPLAVEKAPNSATTNKGYVDDSTLNVNRVLAVVNGAIAQGLYVIIDWHCPESNPYTDKAVSFFGSMAAKFKNTPNVMWEVWNEPTSGDVVGHANKVITAIRNAGNKNLVIVGSLNWSSQPDQVGDVTDPKKNVAYTLHFYAGSGAHDAYRTSMTNAISKGRTVFVTEWGTTTADGNTYNNFSNSQTWLNALDAAKVSSCNWDIGTQHSTPGDVTSAVQGSAAMKVSAGASGGWDPATDLSEGGKQIRSYLRTANASLGFTGPDTVLKMVAPLTATPSNASTTDAISLTASFSREITWTLKMTGQTSGATYSTSGTSSDVSISWKPSTDHGLGKVFTGETVTAAFTGLSLTGTSTTITLKPTSLQPRIGAHETALSWTSKGLMLRSGTAEPGASFSVRLLDLQGREIGATRTAVAREANGQLVLDLVPPAHASGVAFVDLEGPQGQRAQLLLPPVH